MKHWVYRLAIVIVRFLIRILYPLRVTGTEFIPESGPVILCSNHIGNPDPALLAAAVNKRRHIHFMAKAELFNVKPLVPVWKALGVVPVRRGESDMAALRQMMRLLKEGRTLGIFAQGHRDKTGQLAMESGVGLLALRTGATVIPVNLIGPYRLFRRFPIAIGPAVDLSLYQGKNDSQLIKDATAKIEAAVRALAPKPGE